MPMVREDPTGEVTSDRAGLVYSERERTTDSTSEHGRQQPTLRAAAQSQLHEGQKMAERLAPPLCHTSWKFPYSYLDSVSLRVRPPFSDKCTVGGHAR
jgi:hypothetical protein